MPVVALIQARMGSSRLPGKVLEPIRSRPMVARVVERARRIPGVHRVALAIPDNPADDELAAVAAELGGVGLHRGPEDDVLGRFVAAARAEEADVVVRITADCPLLCPEVSGRVVERLAASGADYASNILQRTYPRGLDTEAFTMGALETAHGEASSAAEREHVTPFLWRRPERFRLAGVESGEDRSGLRWTVDTAADLDLVRRIYDALAPTHPDFGYRELLAAWDEHPEWHRINRGVEQKKVEA